MTDSLVQQATSEELEALAAVELSDEKRATEFQARWETGLLEVGPPLHRQLGLKLLRLRPTTVLSMELSDEVRGFYPGSVHGGILATFADVAAATALYGAHDEQSIPVSVEMHIRFYRQPKGGPLTAEVQVVHEGARLLSTECVIRDAQNRVLVRTTGTFAVQPLRQ